LESHKNLYKLHGRRHQSQKSPRQHDHQDGEDFHQHHEDHSHTEVKDIKQKV